MLHLNTALSSVVKLHEMHFNKCYQRMGMNKDNFRSNKQYLSNSRLLMHTWMGVPVSNKRDTDLKLFNSFTKRQFLFLIR